MHSRSVRAASLLLAATLAACDATKPTPSAPDVAGLEVVPLNPASSSYELGVSITSGVSKYGDAGYYTIGSSVSGGTPGYSYYWYSQRCYADGFCTDMELHQAGGTTHTFYVSPDLRNVRFQLKIGDASTETWTGIGDRHFLGPVAVHASLPEPTCVGGDDESIGFPFAGWTSDGNNWVRPPATDASDTTGRAGIGEYRINVCTREKVWRKPKPY